MYHLCGWCCPLLLIKQDTWYLFKCCQWLNEVLQNVGIMSSFKISVSVCLIVNNPWIFSQVFNATVQREQMCIVLRFWMFWTFWGFFLACSSVWFIGTRFCSSHSFGVKTEQITRLVTYLSPRHWEHPPIWIHPNTTQKSPTIQLMMLLFCSSASLSVK